MFWYFSFFPALCETIIDIIKNNCSIHLIIWCWVLWCVVSMYECVEACGGCVGRNYGIVLQTWLLVEVAWLLSVDDHWWRLTSLVDLGCGKDGET